MKCLLKTTNEAKAREFEAAAQREYGAFRIYRFQYRCIDGKFYYEILLNEDEDEKGGNTNAYR